MNRLLNKDGSNIRKFYRCHKAEIDRLLGRPELKQDTPPEPQIDIHQQTLLLLQKKERTLQDMEAQLKTSPRIITAVIDDLKDRGFLIEEVSNTYRIAKAVNPEENTFTLDWEGNKVIRFGVVSDTHLCNKYQQLTFLNHLYDVFAKEGIKKVLHAGDLTDGYYKNRPEHIYELFRVGADEQTDYVIDNYPYRKGIGTYFITGNHDHTHIKNGGINIGKQIARRREDMIYLGPSNAKVNITDNCIVEINHPEDGSSYALSYALQKCLDGLQGGEKPNIFLNGHHHKLFQMFYRNIHAFEVGCIEAQTPWEKGKKISVMVGAWMLNVHVDEEGTIQRMVSEQIPCYRMLKNDY